MFRKYKNNNQAAAFSIINDWWQGKETAYLLDDLYAQEFGWQEDLIEADEDNDDDEGFDWKWTGPNHHDPAAMVHHGKFGCGGDRHI